VAPGAGVQGPSWPSTPLAASMRLALFHNDSVRPSEGGGTLPESPSRAWSGVGWMTFPFHCRRICTGKRSVMEGKLKSNQDDAVEINALDRTISYLFANAGNMIKFGPLGIGFLLFLIYFCQNNFFPGFDLFSLASLLLAAFAIGLAAY